MRKALLNEMNSWCWDWILIIFILWHKQVAGFVMINVAKLLYPATSSSLKLLAYTYTCYYKILIRFVWWQTLEPWMVLHPLSLQVCFALVLLHFTYLANSYGHRLVVWEKYVCVIKIPKIKLFIRQCPVLLIEINVFKYNSLYKYCCYVITNILKLEYCYTLSISLFWNIHWMPDRAYFYKLLCWKVRVPMIGFAKNYEEIESYHWSLNKSVKLS